MTELRWAGMDVLDFATLVRVLPVNALRSPRRSVVPLVDYFRQPGTALAALGHAVEIDLTDVEVADFEHALAVRRGKGKPSYTDVMLQGRNVSVAIEAKYTEPRYKSVRKWLGETPTPNRIKVLSGWLELINGVAATSLEIDAVLELPYQLVHRSASACSSDAAYRALVYLIFGEAPGAYYVDDVAALDCLLGEPLGLGMHVVHVQAHPEPAFKALTDRWDGGERELAEGVRQALLGGSLFRFGACNALYSRPSSRTAV